MSDSQLKLAFFIISVVVVVLGVILGMVYLDAEFRLGTTLQNIS